MGFGAYREEGINVIHIQINISLRLQRLDHLYKMLFKKQLNEFVIFLVV